MLASVATSVEPKPNTLGLTQRWRKMSDKLQFIVLHSLLKQLDKLKFIEPLA